MIASLLAHIGVNRHEWVKQQSFRLRCTEIQCEVLFLLLVEVNSSMPLKITMTSWWARWRLKSPASPLFTQPFIRAQTKKNHQSSASLAFVQRIHRVPVNSPHKWPVTRKMFPFDDVIMITLFYIPWNFTASSLWRHMSDITITDHSIICRSTAYSGWHQWKHQSSMLLVLGIRRWSMDSPHKGPVTRKMFPWHGVFMLWTAALRQTEKVC